MRVFISCTQSNYKGRKSLSVCLWHHYLKNPALYEVDIWQVYCSGPTDVQCHM
ncbi:hypothetical protein LDENG_00062330 [Lucifuga dentata]|nr:hypothetical protein LDENG_00062330 [Lucifuga dentata]